MPLSDVLIRRAFDAGVWKAYRDDNPITADQLTINQHSINVSLGGEIRQVVGAEETNFIIDLHDRDSLETYIVPMEKNRSWLLEPNRLYLATVREHFNCNASLNASGKWGEDVNFYQTIDGRSTAARCGISVHVTSGRGDYGFASPFTLEITVGLPILVHYGDELAQIYFEEIQGRVDKPYDGAYSHQRGPTPPTIGRERFQRHGVKP